MAIKPYIGIDNKARQVKKCYVGISDKARAVKKAYIGIDGKARCIFNGSKDTLSYYGTLTTLKRIHASSATVGKFALIYGGEIGNSYLSATRSFSTSLVQSSVDSDRGRGVCCGASLPNAAVFATGYDKQAGVYPATLLVYDASLVYSTPNSLSTGGTKVSCACAGDFIIFAGGFDSASNRRATEAFNKDFTKVSIGNLPNHYKSLSAVTGPNVAVFAGGLLQVTSSSAEVSDSVYAYDSSLTLITLASLSVARRAVAGACLNKNIIFAGGYTDTGTSSSLSQRDLGTNVVDAYDESLVAIGNIDSLSAPTGDNAATTLGNYALFAGGYDRGKGYISNVDAYDASLSKVPQHNLSTGRSGMAAATVGDYALFVAGNGDYSTDTVNVFQLT